MVAAACGARDTDALAEGAGQLLTSGAWARAADSGAATAVYFMLENRGDTADTLRAARSAAAEETGLHISTQRDGMMHMTEIPALPVPPGDSVAFRPLGAHVMLMRLHHPLRDGDSVTVTLEFGSGRSLEVRAGVRQP
jgi:periplasmic copper chaperone A